MPGLVFLHTLGDVNTSHGYILLLLHTVIWHGPTIFHRCAPALARQRVCSSVPQGALFSHVGIPGRPPAVPQGDWTPGPEDPGWRFTPASWRGEAGSSHCWRQVRTKWQLICLLLITTIDMAAASVLLFEFSKCWGKAGDVTWLFIPFYIQAIVGNFDTFSNLTNCEIFDRNMKS